MADRKKIPKVIKDAVRSRQNKRCAVCLNYGRHFHHVIAVAIDKTQELNYYNIMMLCKYHHKLFHLGDPATIQSVYEYAYYVQMGELPEEMDLIEICEEVVNNTIGKL